MVVRTLLFVLIASLTLAGCTSPGPGSADGPMVPGTNARDGDAGDPEPLGFAACRQFHTYYPARAQDFADGIPRGFTVVADEQGLTTLRAEASDCATGPGQARAGMLWITVPVVPPAEWSDPGAAHQFAVEAYIDSAAALEALHAWGAATVEPCSCGATTVADHAGPDGFVSDGREDDYTLQTALLASSGAFPGGQAHVYVLRGDGVGRLNVASEESTSRGFGATALAYVGPGAAPPVFPGQIGHVVDGLEFTMDLEPGAP